MREIKFRAWDKNKKEMREVTAINWYEEWVRVDESPMSGEFLPIESTPLMQPTGLYDKNGKEIAIDDIVRVCIEGNFSTDVGLGGEWFYKNIKVEADLVFGCNLAEFLKIYHTGDNKYVFNEDYEVEIIGNIYENPELLNK